MAYFEVRGRTVAVAGVQLCVYDVALLDFPEELSVSSNRLDWFALLLKLRSFLVED